MKEAAPLSSLCNSNGELGGTGGGDSVTGTVEDLDRELPQTLLHFVSSHLELKNSLERAKAEMEEASKAAKVEARKKSGSQTTKKDPAVNSSKPAVAPKAPVKTRSKRSI